MLVLAGLAAAFFVQSVPPAAIDVSALEIGPPASISPIDAGRLKGEPRRLAWSPDAALLYLQTAEGTFPREKLHHYTVSLDGGTVRPLEAEPEWAAQYWAVKQDRSAPGIPSLRIEIEQQRGVVKLGVRPAGALDRTASPDAAAGTISPEAGHGDQGVQVVRLSLLGHEIARWSNERVIPGTRFSWGPSGSSAIVFVGEAGRLVLLDGQKRTRTIEGVKDAMLPAWSTDGARLAYLSRIGRKKYRLSWLGISR